MLGGTKRRLAVLVAVAAMAALPGVAHAQGDPGTLSILVLGDSYSSGNGAGAYSGAPACRRSTANYARQFEQLVEAAPGGLPTTVENQACSGAVTRDILQPRGARPAQLSAVNGDDDIVFLTIGGNDIGFGSIVASCLLVLTRNADACDGALRSAEHVLADGTMKARLTNVLTAIRARAGTATKIVLLGYPYLEGDATYTVPSTRPTFAPVQAGKRIRALSDAGDAIGRVLTATLPGTVYVSTTKPFSGHELSAMRPNPDRWFVAPLVDAPLGQYDLWYHPNKAGHAAEAKLLFDDARVPKVDVR
ncbi:MAG: Lipase 2 precursor [Actinomycetia bacterium]|nr:Lipase 2 precursor [Actinomycetes bacterium]